MPYNPDTEKFFQSPSTIVDSTPDGDTVQEGFDNRNSPAISQIYEDFNMLKADGMIGVGVPASEAARGIGRVATAEEVAGGATGPNGPAFVTPETHTASLVDSVTSTDKKRPATANSVKQAYDRAVEAENSIATPNAAAVKKALNATGYAPIYACRAWVSFDGTGTVSIRSSGNVSSITDNGTGDYTINFTTPMPDNGYSFSATSNSSDWPCFLSSLPADGSGVTLNSLRVQVFTPYPSSPGARDVTNVTVSIFR